MPSASANLVTILLRFRDLQRRCSVLKVEIIFYVFLKREISWWITWICIVCLIILGWKNVEDGLFSKDFGSGFYCAVTCIILFLVTSQVLTTKSILTAKYIHNSWTYSKPFLILSGPTLNTFISRFNVFLTLYRDISVQWQTKGRIIYFQFISIINLLMFWTGLLLIIRRYYSVYTTTVICRG